jgi:hypothetical protein
MNSINRKTIILVIITIIVHFYLPLPFIGFNFDRKRNYLNRIYLAIFTSFIIVLIDIIINNNEFTTTIFYVWLILLILGISVFYYIISNQLFVSEEDYLLTMKENHEIDLHIVEAISKHQNLDEKGKIYTEHVKNNRIDELNHLDKLIK